MLKLIANPHVFANFSEADPTNGNVYKGIDLLGEQIKWMNKDTSANFRCDNTLTIGKIFCSAFENYINYNRYF